jgi:hypothetical protein
VLTPSQVAEVRGQGKDPDAKLWGVCFTMRMCRISQEHTENTNTPRNFDKNNISNSMNTRTNSSCPAFGGVRLSAPQLLLVQVFDVSWF